MSEYTYDEIMRMQNDAVRRVEDMQRKAREVSGIGLTKEEKKTEEGKRIAMPDNFLNSLKGYASDSSYREKKKDFTEDISFSGNDSVKSLSEKLNVDRDTVLILSLVLLLSEEKADEMLLISLLYILT